MAKRKNKLKKKISAGFKKVKKIPAHFYTIGVFVIFLLMLVVPLFTQIFIKNLPDSVYIYPENAKQGDTVFVRVKSGAKNITGNFGSEKMFFYKKTDSPEWVSFLGIDADQNPGDYKIYIDGGLNKEIKIIPADFSSATSAQAPSPTKIGQTQQKVAENIVKTDNSAINKVLANLTPEPYFTGPFSFPLSTMKQSGFSFGKFISFAQYKLQHFGIDLKAPEKTNIYAVNDGKVVLTSSLPDYGKTVIIDHGLGIFSMYLHLDEFKVSVGDMVKNEHIIGLSGDSGYSSAPHLHFSIRVDGSRVDPIAFIQTTQKMNDSIATAAIVQTFKNIFK